MTMRGSPAERVCTRDDEEAWLEARKDGIGGSEAGAAIGVSDHKTRLRLYYEKTGVLPREDISEKEHIIIGQELEEGISNIYKRKREKPELRLIDPQALYQHREYPWLIGTPDRISEGERIVIDCKNVSYGYWQNSWGQAGTDQVPDDIKAQALHYMILLDFLRCDIAALVGGRKLHIYHIVYDPEEAEMLLKLERRFWDRVQNDEPPPPDFDHPKESDTFDALLHEHGIDDKTIRLPERADDCFRRMSVAKREKKRAERIWKRYKAELKSLLGNAKQGESSCGKISQTVVGETPIEAHTRRSYVRPTITLDL